MVKPGLARIEFRHFIVIDEASFFAAVLSECAADQGAFWDFHDRYMAADARLFDWDYVLGFAGELGMNVNELRRCMVEQDHVPAIEQMEAEARALGVTGTPTIFVNGEAVEQLSLANIIAAVRAAQPE